jgi:ketosteroid isomerase-like protein
MKWTGIFLTILILLSCLHQPSQNMKPEAKEQILREINAMFGKLTHFSEIAQADSFLSFYENYPDFIHIGGDGKMRDFEGFKKICNDYYDSLKEQKISMVTEKTKILDTNLAISAWTVNILAYFKNGDMMRMDNYSITYLVRKIDGQWKIIHTHESSLPPELIKKT